MAHTEEEMGMSDLQFKDHLRGLIAELERIKADGVSDKAEADINALIERFKAALED